MKDLEEQYDRIYRYCYFKVRQREAAEDITQETFLRFLEKKQEEDPGRHIRYLYTIARNLCIDACRRRRDNVLDDETFQNTAGSDEEGIILRISVREALNALEEEDRELALLRYVNEVPISVISEITGRSRFALYRALKRVKKELQNKLGKQEV